MSDDTAIQWTDSTWPVVTGCTHLSEGCDNCYAARLTSGRLKHLPAYTGLAEKGKFNGQVRLLPDRLGWPLKWRKPRQIFVSDMADLFHESVPDGYIAQVWNVMGRCPQHTFQILTKRHARMRSWVTQWADVREEDEKRDGLPPMPRGARNLREVYRSGRARLFADMLDSMGEPPEGCAYPLYDWMEGQRWWPSALPNVHLGVSAENQKWADIRIPALLETPAAVRFVSAEPLLGPVGLRPGKYLHPIGGGPCVNLKRPWEAPPDPLDWVIIGGESGPGARRMNEGWARTLVEQCQDTGTSVFVKQLGAVLGKEYGAGSHGADWNAWPEDLRVRQFPHATELMTA